MNWLTPLGFLGLTGLIVLILIYIIKPNYQQKFISSTYVWKQSLKYRKKQLPINRLRNILLFLCQVLVIAACAAALAQPFLAGENRDRGSAKIAIIDASAGMRAATDGVTRFERAVAEVQKLADETLSDDGELTVILAGSKASYVLQRAGAGYRAEAKQKLEELVSPDRFACTYGTADMDGAVELAESVLLENPDAEVVLYTGSAYTDAGKIRVVDVSDVGEWNAAVLDVRAETDENYYRFEVDVACYNRDRSLDVYLDINGVNIALEQYRLSGIAECTGNAVTTVVFDLASGLFGDYRGVYSYDYAHAYVKENDSLSDDNSFYLYGGARQPLKVQYYSTLTNSFYGGVLMGLREALKGYWELDIDEIQDSIQNIELGVGKDYALEGYDIYIFEHTMPPTLPTDGLVILASPDKAPAGAGFTLANWYKSNTEFRLDRETSHALLQGLTVENITVTQWASITAYEEGYTPLASCNGSPVLLAKNGENEKVLVMGLNLNYSNFPLTAEFPLFFFNLLNWYFPQTVGSYVYEVNDAVTLNARASQLSFSGPDARKTLTELPETVTVTVPGTYTLLQTPISGNDIVENFYVRIPMSASNTEAVYDALPSPYYPPKADMQDRDLVFYVALTLVLLLFAEWWLQTREHYSIR